MTRTASTGPLSLGLLAALAFVGPASAQLDLRDAGGADPGPARLRDAFGVEIATLLRELQWTAPDPRDLSMVWLVPNRLLEALLVQGGRDTSQARATVSVFEPYLVVGVVRGYTHPESGQPTFEPAPVVRTSLRAIDENGAVHAPLVDVSPHVAGALVAMERTLGAVLGELGAHTTLLVFEATRPDGRALLPLTRRARFAIELDALGILGAHRVTWRLPFAALLVDRRCPVCEESFNGAWRFCPWDGAPLESEPTETPGSRKERHRYMPGMF